MTCDNCNDKGLYPECPICGMKGIKSDNVNSPSHYQSSNGIECIDAIEAALTPEEFRGFLKGNSIKYLWRNGKKGDAAEDAEKGNWYMIRLIAKLEALKG